MRRRIRQPPARTFDTKEETKLAAEAGSILLSYVFIKALFNFTADPALLKPVPAIAGGSE